MAKIKNPASWITNNLIVSSLLLQFRLSLNLFHSTTTVMLSSTATSMFLPAAPRACILLQSLSVGSPILVNSADMRLESEQESKARSDVSDRFPGVRDERLGKAWGPRDAYRFGARRFMLRIQTRAGKYVTCWNLYDCAKVI